jgi:pimeloyl-ACP methyl ester carboxylesterase
MPEARINGIEVHYREKGEGFPVFLLHGFTGNLRNWAFQIPALTGDFRVVSIDHRGHGHSEKPTQPDDYSLEIMADDAYGLMAHLGIREFFLVGHSMGGMIAQHVALAHPDAVRALVLMDTAAEMPDGLRTQERVRLIEIARDQGMETVFEEQLHINPMADQLRAQPLLLQTWRQQFLLTSREAYLYCAQAMASREPLVDELSQISVPTLIICGENDDPFLEPSRQMRERISGSELVIIPGSGHTPQIEKPADLNQALTGFLSRVHQGVATGG